MKAAESVAPEAPATPHVYQAITAVARELAKTGITKSRRNQAQGFNFRGIDDVYNVLGPLLAENNLCIIPRVIERTCVERQSTKGTTLFSVCVRVEFDVVSSVDGSRHVGAMFGEAMDSGDKATNKAQSTAYKYFALELFCVPTEGDNDPDATVHSVAPAADAQGEPPTLQALWDKAKQKGVAIRAILAEFKREEMKDLTALERVECWQMLLDTPDPVGDQP